MMHDSDSLSLLNSAIPQKANKYRVYISSGTHGHPVNALHKKTIPKTNKVNVLPFGGFAGTLPPIGRNVPLHNAKRVFGSAKSVPLACTSPQKRTRNFVTTSPTHHKARPKTRSEFTAPFSKLQLELNRDFSVSEEDQSAIVASVTGGTIQRFTTQFIAAAALGHTSVLEQFLSINCATTLDRKYLVNSEDQFKRSALFYAVHQKQKKAIDLLLEKGADLYKRDLQGRTVLHYAAISGNRVEISSILDRELIKMLSIKRNFRDDPLSGTAGPKESSEVEIEYRKAKTEEYKSSVFYHVQSPSRHFELNSSFEKEYVNSTEHKKSLIKFVNLRDNKDRTALHVAAFYGNLPAVKTLIEYNASLFIRDYKKRRPVDVATEPKVKDVLLTSMNRLISESRGLLLFHDYHYFRAILQGQINLKVNLSIAHMITLSCKALSSFAYGLHSDNYLTYAIREENREAIEYLLGRGVSPLASDEYGRNALHYAAEFESLPSLMILLEGASSESAYASWVTSAWKALDMGTKEDGLLPFHIASIKGNSSVLKYLIHIAEDRKKVAGAKYLDADEMLEYKAKYSMTPLLLAVQYNMLESFQYLAMIGADIYIKNTRMQNALHLAAINNNEDIVKWLMAKDAEECTLKQAKDYRGKTPEQYAKKEETRNAMLSLWESIRAGDLWKIQLMATRSKGEILRHRHSDTGDTPLHYAIRLGQSEVVRLLAELEAPKDIMNSEGKTVGDLVSEIVDPEVQSKIKDVLEKAEKEKTLLKTLRATKVRRFTRTDQEMFY